MFGSLCYVHNKKHRGDKFATRSNRSIFLGYPFTQKGWRVYNIDTGVVSVSRDVIFSEIEFLYLDQVSPVEPESPVVQDVSVSISDDDLFAEPAPSPSSSEPEAPSETTPAAPPAIIVATPPGSFPSKSILPPANTTYVVLNSEEAAVLPDENGVDIDTPPPEILGRGHCTK